MAAGLSGALELTMRPRYIAPPRLVGGEVTCLIVPAGEDDVSRAVEEILPGQGGRYALIHRHEGIDLRDLSGPGDGTDIARCERGDEVPLACSVTLLPGTGLRLWFADSAGRGMEPVGVTLDSPAGDWALVLPDRPDRRWPLGSSEGEGHELGGFLAAFGDGRGGIGLVEGESGAVAERTGTDLAPEIALARRVFIVIASEVLPR